MYIHAMLTVILVYQLCLSHKWFQVLSHQHKLLVLPSLNFQIDFPFSFFLIL